MTTKKKVKKLPKPGTWKAIEHELRIQDAWGEQVVDGDSFLVFGKFKQKAIDALTDRYPFSALPVSGVLFLKNNPRFKERLRFGGNSVVRKYILWDKQRFFTPNGIPFLEKSVLNWNYRNVIYESDASDDRYICKCSMEGSADYLTEYFYMDRVI